MAKGFRVEFAKSAEDDLLEIVAWYRRLLKNDASPRECAGYAQGKGRRERS